MRSQNAPAEVNVGAWVLPISTTSGVSESLESDVVSFSTRPSHSCCSMVSVEPGFCSSKVFFSQSRASCGVSVPLSQTRMSAVSAAPSSSDDGPSSSLPHAASVVSASAATATAGNDFLMRTTVFLPSIFQWVPGG